MLFRSLRPVGRNGLPHVVRYGIHRKLFDKWVLHVRRLRDPVVLVLHEVVMSRNVTSLLP